MAAGGGFVVVDYGSPSETSPVAIAGVCTLALEAPGPDWWRISRITVTNTSTAQTKAFIYEGSVDAVNFLDSTRRGGMNGDPNLGDVAEYPNPIPLPGGIGLVIQWTGCTAGAWGIARVTYEILRRGAPSTHPLLG